MRIFILLQILVVSIHFGNAQTISNNYVKSYKAIVPLVGDISLVNDKEKVVETIEYYDGLGRPSQSIIKQGSRNGFDLVNFWIYDSYGRKTTSYLPYAASSADGNLKVEPIIQQGIFYQNLLGSEGQNPFSIQTIENSELNRILKIGSPGTIWQPDGNPYSTSDRTVKKRVEFNQANEVINFSFIESTGSITYKDGTVIRYYPSNLLNTNRTIDEHGNDVIEYTDKEGRVICKKVKATSSTYATTYYVYDILGNLAVVLSPEATEKLIQETSNQ